MAKGRAAAMIAQRLHQNQNSSAKLGSPGRPVPSNATKKQLQGTYKRGKGAGYAA